MFNLICGKVLILGIDFTLLIYAHVCILMSAFGTTTIIAMAIKWKQIQNLLYPKHLKMPSRRSYNLFLKHTSVTLYLFSVANSSFGKAMFSYLVVNCPINCVIVVAILIGVPNSPINLIIFSIYALQQFVCIFIIHIFIVNVNEKLHSPVKRVIHLSICDRKLAKFSRTKMKICNYIMAFHTKKRYGVTYMSFGLISVSSFGKVY